MNCQKATRAFSNFDKWYCWKCYINYR